MTATLDLARAASPMESGGGCAGALAAGLRGLGWAERDTAAVLGALGLREPEGIAPGAEATALDDALALLSRLAEHGGGDRRSSGSFYTAADVSDYITTATVVGALVDRVPELAATFDVDAAITANHDLRSSWRAACAGLATSARVEVAQALLGLRVLDPTCGAGAFLDTAGRLLRQLWSGAGLGTPPVTFPIANLVGVDLDPRAVVAARCVLVLQAAEAGGTDTASALAAAAQVTRSVVEGDATRPLPEVAWGVDAVVGNPPYVRAGAVDAAPGLRTASCGNLYAWVTERALEALAPGGRIGLVVPVSSLCADAFEPYRALWRDACSVVWASSYDAIPCTLFPGTVQRLAILLGRMGEGPSSWQVTRYHKWRAAERPDLFRELRYTAASPHGIGGSLAKVGTELERELLERLFRHAPAGELLAAAPAGAPAPNRFFYKRRWSYFLFFADFMPDIFDAAGERRAPTEFKSVDVVPDLDHRALMAAFSSSLFYWYFTVFSDNRNVNVRELAAFPFDRPTPQLERGLAALGEELMHALRANSELRTCTYRSIGTIRNQYFFQARTRPVLDRIDAALADHYGLTAEQLQFVLDFEASYRR